MINVIASIRTRPGCLNEYLVQFKRNIPHVLAEEGCLEYVPCVDAHTGWESQDLDGGRVTVVEKWESMEALRAHSVAPHMVALREKVGHLVESVSLQVVAAA